MNHIFGTGESPYDNEPEQIECQICVGTGLVFEPDGTIENEPINGREIECPNCLGSGLIDREDGYTKEQDYLDDEADNRIEDNYMLNDD